MNESLEFPPTRQPDPGPPLKLTEAGSTDPTFAGRRELKYLLRRHHVDLARQFLESRFERVVFNRPVSVVRSIYFDTHKLSTCRANLDGVGKRHKVRLRWYDRPLPDKQVYFEVKWRENLVTGKYRSAVMLQRPLAQISYRQLQRGLDQVLPESSRVYGHIYDEPVVIVQYQREHFVSRELGLRMTLDYDLVFYDQTGRLSPVLGVGIPLEDLALIEAKSKVPAPQGLTQLLHPLAQRVSRCSKYVHGCAQVGRIPVSATW